MKVFLWVMVINLGLICIGKLYFLALGPLPSRTPAKEAIDVVFNAGFLIWAAVLLATL